MSNEISMLDPTSVVLEKQNNIGTEVVSQPSTVDVSVENSDDYDLLADANTVAGAADLDNFLGGGTTPEDEQAQFNDPEISNKLFDRLFSRTSDPSEANGETAALLDKIPPSQAAKILLSVEKRLQQRPGEIIQLGVYDQLRTNVLENPLAAGQYFAEKYADMDAKSLSTEIQQVAKASQEQKPLEGSQLYALLEASNRNDPALSEPDAVEAIAQLNAELDGRKTTAVSISNSIIESTESDLAEIVGDSAKISNVERVGEAIEIMTSDSSDSENKVAVKITQAELWTATLSIMFFRKLLGDGNIGTLLEGPVGEKFSKPALLKLGLQPEQIEVLSRQFAKGNYETMDRFLRYSNSKQIESMFEDSIKNNTAFEIVQQLHPDHLKKIFDPSGTKKFGRVSSNFFNTDDHLELSQELVDKIYNQLTDAQKNELKIAKSIPNGPSAAIENPSQDTSAQPQAEQRVLSPTPN